MYFRNSCVDHIDSNHVTEEYIDSLTAGQTLDFMVGKSCGMFHEHYCISDIEDPILDQIVENCCGKHSVIQTLTVLLEKEHEFYINHEYGTVYVLEQWTPSVRFFEQLASEFSISFIPIVVDGKMIIDAAIELSDVRVNLPKQNSNVYFEAKGNTYSEAMCKCILKVYYDFGYNN